MYFRSLQARDQCLQGIQLGLKEKEQELEEQLANVKQDLKTNFSAMTTDDLNSKKFLCNVLETRLKRQKRHTVETYKRAENRVHSDPRIVKLLH